MYGEPAWTLGLRDSDSRLRLAMLGYRSGEGLRVLDVVGLRADGYYKGLNRSQYYFGGVPDCKYSTNGPQNPILITKAPIVWSRRLLEFRFQPLRLRV